ncbi:MAG: radical SAM protein [Spirochaetia bacterium]|nr:radical SAM protein [Spirochaetia bacterium]
MTISRKLYENCVLCPKKCRVNRLEGKTGFCGSASDAILSCSLLHRGEEPPVTGDGGSGTIFFSGCTLRCGFCQNHQISRGILGRIIDEEVLSDIMISLQKEGAENINLVTATHFIPSVFGAAEKAKKKGLSIPLLWNTSGYETEEAVEMLLEFIDVFLPDLKTLDPALSARLFKAQDYPCYASKAVLKMADGRKTEPALIEKEGVIKKGVIVRHLVLPGELTSTDQFLKWFSENLQGRAILSLMFQYEPDAVSGEIDLPARRVSGKEADEVYGMLDRYDIDEGFIQEMEGEASWVPDFNRSNPFPGSGKPGCSETGTGCGKNLIWHWKEGFNLS